MPAVASPVPVFWDRSTTVLYCTSLCLPYRPASPSLRRRLRRRRQAATSPAAARSRLASPRLAAPEPFVLLAAPPDPATPSFSLLLSLRKRGRFCWVAWGPRALVPSRPSALAPGGQVSRYKVSQTSSPPPHSSLPVSHQSLSIAWYLRCFVCSSSLLLP